MQYLDSVPGLERAQNGGAFIPVDLDYEDFAINISLGWIITDSVQTLAAVQMPPEAQGFQISRGWLTDDTEKATPLNNICQLSPEAAFSTGYPEHRVLLSFGPISPRATTIRLEINRLEQETPDLDLLSPVVDPLGELVEEQALHVMAWDEPDNPMEPVPAGVIAGCWAFELELFDNPAILSSARPIAINRTLPLGNNTLRILSIKQGLTAWQVSSLVEDPVTKEYREEELLDAMLDCAHADEWIQQLSDNSMLPSNPPPIPQMCLRYEEGGELVKDLHMYGPTGCLGRCFHHLFPPPHNLEASDSEKPFSVNVVQILQYPLPEPWEYRFNPKTIDTPYTDVEFSLPALNCDCHLQLGVEGLYWQEDSMLLRPVIHMEGSHPEDVPIKVADCTIVNPLGERHDCMGQQMVELEEDQKVYGWVFPPLHRLMQVANFNVQSIDIVPSQPIEIPLTPAPEPEELDQAEEQE